MDESRIEIVTELYKKMHRENPGKSQGVGWNGTSNAELCYSAVGDQVDRILDRDASILDVGCGYGNLHAYLRHQFILGSADYTGIDPNELAIQAAKEKYPEVKFEHADHTMIEGKYDVVVGIGTLSFYDYEAAYHVARSMWEATYRMTVLVWNNMTTDIGDPAVFAAALGCDSWSLHHDFSAEHYMMVFNR